MHHTQHNLLTTPQQGAGPFDLCPGPCQHTECADGLRLATTPCAVCYAPLGQGAQYLASLSGFDGPLHATCAARQFAN